VNGTDNHFPGGFPHSPGLCEYPQLHDLAKAEGVSLYSVLPQFNADIERVSMVIAHNPGFYLPSVTMDFLRYRFEPPLLVIYSRPESFRQ